MSNVAEWWSVASPCMQIIGSAQADSNRAWEITTLLISQLGPVDLAAQSILGTTQFLLYLPALSISVASSIRIGNLLGADGQSHPYADVAETELRSWQIPGQQR